MAECVRERPKQKNQKKKKKEVVRDDVEENPSNKEHGSRDIKTEEHNVAGIEIKNVEEAQSGSEEGTNVKTVINVEHELEETNSEPCEVVLDAAEGSSSPLPTVENNEAQPSPPLPSAEPSKNVEHELEETNREPCEVVLDAAEGSSSPLPTVENNEAQPSPPLPSAEPSNTIVQSEELIAENQRPEENESNVNPIIDTVTETQYMESQEGPTKGESVADKGSNICHDNTQLYGPSAPPPSFENYDIQPSAPLPSLETSEAVIQPKQLTSESVKTEGRLNDTESSVLNQDRMSKLQSVRPKEPKQMNSMYENVEFNKHRDREKESNAIRPRSTVITNVKTARNIIKERVTSTQAASLGAVAFTEEQLNYFYFNAELQQLDYFIDEFLKNSDKEKHEFYELILFYYKSRRRLAEILDEIQTLQNQVKDDRKSAWTIKQCILNAEGTCGCGVKVAQQQSYQQAFFEKDVSVKITGCLFKIRDIVHKTLPLEFYNSQVARIRIENYLAKLFKNSAPLSGLNSTTEISALLPANIHSATIPVLCQLQDCITVLFVFKRYGVLEEAFSRDIDYWLSLLVAALQRVGTLPDSFFLLNHLLRCPPSTVPNICNFVQFPKFAQSNLVTGKWNSPLIHHFVVMLATLTLPVRSRKKFLSKFKMNIKNPKLNRGISWTLMDEDKEEDENQEDSWSLMMEVDLISIFEQFPFTQLMVYLLNMEESDGTLSYSARTSSSNDLMSLFAFTTCIISLLGKIFDTYNLLRYRQFLKCISRTIRLVTQVVSDHWLAYRNYRLDVVGDLPNAFPANANAGIPQFSLEKLQVEFDQIFLKASKRILSSHSSGAIQFLSTMPFEAINLQSVWVMMNMILHQDKELRELLHTSGPHNVPSVRFLEVSPSEGIFLLTALSNMAVSRTAPEDRQLIEAISIQILEISFLNVSLNTLYSKNGRDFLATIAAKHPYIISALLECVDHQKNDLKEVMTYIFEALPIDTWKPKETDIERIRGWLLECPTTSEENQLARLLLAKLNYGAENNEYKLFLPRSFHYAIAVLVVEAFGVSFPDFPGGIKKLDNTNVGIIAQVGKLAVSSYTKIMQSRAHTEFLSWGWDVLLKLKLHETDMQQQNSRDDDDDDHGDASSVNTEDLANMNWTEQMLTEFKGKRPYEFDVELTPKLINVNLALKSKGFLASYVAFAMTKEGHFVDMFLSKGLDYLVSLNDWYQFEAVMKIIHCIVPVFLNCPEQLTTPRFVQVMNKLIHVDVDKAGYTEKIWQYFIAGTYSQKLAAVVTSQVLKARSHSTEQAMKIISFWMFIFLKMPLWARDCGVLFQVDSLCKAATTINGGLSLIEDLLYAEYKNLIKSQEPRGLISSVMSWISTNQHISLMPSVSADFCYYASTVLAVEQRFEIEVGLWKELSSEMLRNSSVPLEEIYKRCCSNLKSVYLPPLNYLSIYRFGQQAMVTPPDHPFLPILWKQFFVIFLKKPTTESGLPSRTGVGARFYTNFTMSSTLKKMKSTLLSAASYHQEKGTPTEGGNTPNASAIEKEHHYSEVFHQKLSVLYQGLSLWLEESRLHDPNLYIDALPDAYIPELLVKVFQGNEEVWYSYVNSETIQRELDTIADLWSNSLQITNITQPSPNEDVVTQATYGQKIIRRLCGESCPRPPPEVVQPKTPVDEPSLHVILTQPRFFQVVNHDLQCIVQYAKTSSVLAASHVGLDTEFLEMLPDLYEMVNRKMVLYVPCDGLKRKDGCKSPAQISVRFDELRLRERVMNLLDDNRQAFDQILTNSRETFPENLCLGTVHVENIIEKLSEAFLSLDSGRREELQQSASQLFYLLAELIDDDVKRCYPAIQFFSSGVEVLGKAYIADTSSEQMKLLETILTHNSSVMFLAPHFYPMIAMDQFVELYTKMVSHMADDNFTSIFVLLSKFDVQLWLSRTPAQMKINDLLMVVMKGITSLGSSPNSEGMVVLEIFRNHMTLLFSNDINEYISTVLTEILIGSSQTSISPLCWTDFLSVLRFENSQPGRVECVLTMDRVKESLQYMANFFEQNCASVNCELETFYNAWLPYIKPLSNLLSSLLEYSIQYSLSAFNNRDRSVVLKEIWEDIIGVYKPWLVPKCAGKIWTLLRTDKVLVMIQSFTDSIRFVLQLVTADQINGMYCSILNEVWSFYSHSVLPTVAEQQSLDLFNGLSTMLPWLHYFPTVEEMTWVMQVYVNHTNAFQFYGEILLQVDWSAVSTNYIESGNESVVGRFHHLLLNILLMLATSKSVSESAERKLTALLQQTASFQWNHLVVEDTARTCQWYAHTVNSELLLDRQSIVWHILSFLQNVTGFHSRGEQSGTTSEVLVMRRNVYFQTVTNILTRCSSAKNRIADFQFVFDGLLSAIETTISYNTTNPMNELVLHCSTFLCMLNSVPQGPFSSTLKSTLESHLLSTTCSMTVLALISACSRSVASLQEMVSLLETAIGVHFTRLSEGELTNSWVPVMQAFVVPELSKDDFVNEAIRQNAFLTLYSFNLRRMMTATSQREQYDVMVDCVQWCSKPQLNEKSESKLLLLFLQVFDVVRCQLAQFQYSNNELRSLAKYMMFLSASCQSQGEDKTYSGVLGAIGIGRKSALTKEFRITTKAIHLFLSCQLPSALTPIRHTPESPGAIRNSPDKSARATTEAEKAFTAFQNLAKNKNYQTMKEQINWVVKFVADPNNAIKDGCTLVAYLCKQFFHKENFIAASVV